MVCLHWSFITLSKLRFASPRKQAGTVPTPMQNTAPQLITKGNALAQYLLQAKSHWMCQWTHSFDAQSYIFSEVKWSLIRAKLPSVGTFFPWNKLFFLTPEPSLDIQLRFQKSRNLDIPRSFCRVNSCLWATDPPWQDCSTICAPLKKPGPTATTHHTVVQLCPEWIASLFLWLTEIWHRQWKISKVACADQRRGCLAGWRLGQYFFLPQEQHWKITPLSQCRSEVWSVSFPCLW